MEVICLEEPAFYKLIEEVVERLKATHDIVQNEWITPEDAMKLLNLGKTTMQNLRDNGEIKYTQPQRNNILYSRTSIMEYLEKHAKHTF